MAERPQPSEPETPGVVVDDERAGAAWARTDAEALGAEAPKPVDAGPARRTSSFGVFFWMAVGWLGVVVICAAFADVLPGVQDPNRQDFTTRLADPFTANRILGGDGLGRDILARLVHGARVSVVISLSAVGIGMSVGGTLGMTVGFLRGRVEQSVVAVMDIVIAFPGLVILLSLVAYLGQNLQVIAGVVGVLSIPIYTRIARANTLSVAQREFVLAAQAMGARRGRILFREILPNVILPVMAFGLIAMGVVIVLEGALAFLGLSVELPQATWGGMISEGNRYIFDKLHVALIPSGVMFLTVLSLNFVGDTLRSRFDVREANL